MPELLEQFEATPASLKEILRTLRSMTGLDGTPLAARAGVSTQLYRRWENGQRPANFADLERVAGYYERTYNVAPGRVTAILRQAWGTPPVSSSTTLSTPLALLALGFLDINLLPFTLLVSIAFLVYLNVAGLAGQKVSARRPPLAPPETTPIAARLLDQILPRETRRLGSLGHDFVDQRTEEAGRRGIEVWEIRDREEIPVLARVLNALSQSPEMASREEAIILMAYDRTIEEQLLLLAGENKARNLKIVVVSPEQSFRNDQANLQGTLEAAFQDARLRPFVKDMKDKALKKLDLFAMTDNWIIPEPTDVITFGNGSLTLPMSDLGFRLHLISRVLDLVHEAETRSGSSLQQLFQGLKASEAAQEAA
jgi:transcriptional regulator with XRE-family HTH domain